MEPLTLLLSGALFLLSALLIYKYSAKRRRYAALIDLLPGPKSYPIIGTIHEFFNASSSDVYGIGNRHCNLYSPIYRMWTGPVGEVHVTSPLFCEAIISGMKHIEKGWTYKFLHPWLGQGLLTSSGSKWHSRRKIITPTFHFQILETFSDVFSENGQIVVEKLQQQVDIHGENGFDICPFITRCALDIICETAMGVKIRSQDGKHSEYLKAVLDISELTMQRGFRPWLFIDFIFNMSKIGKQYNKCLRVLHGFTNKVIQERKAEMSKSANTPIQAEDHDFGVKKRKAFLDLLLEASSDGQMLTDSDIREEVDTFMFEGHDTTTAAISWALFLLGLHPEVQEKVFEELESVFHGSDRPITTRDCQELKYLERVIKETLRIYPSVPFIIRNLEGDIECGGYTLPDGVMVIIHILHCNRSPESFPNPLEFNPDNFLPERVQGRHPYAYIPFSAGPRNCIGQKFAMLEEKIVLASILRRFKLRSLDTRDNIKITVDLILRPANGVKMVLTRR